jgi:hypothetical protein
MADMSSTTRILAVTASARRFYLPQTQSLLLAADVTPRRRKLEPTAGFSLRAITNPDADIAEDKVTTAAGSYNATCPNSPS